MKKAKVMLSALAILAVVSTAFAFKANRYTTHFIYTGALNGTLTIGSCTTEADGRAISNGTPTVYASLSSNSTTCPAVFTTGINDN